MRSRLPLVLGVISLLLLASVSGFFYSRRLKERELALQEKAINKDVVSRADNPIEKRFAIDNTGFQYIILGSLDGELVKFEEGDNWAFKGNLIIKGDSLKRRIPVTFLNPVYLGEYKEGSFDGDSVWRLSDVSKVQESVMPGKDIQVTINYIVPAGTPFFDDILEDQKILDNLINEFNTREFKYEIPENFVLIIQHIGVLI